MSSDPAQGGTPDLYLEAWCHEGPPKLFESLNGRPPSLFLFNPLASAAPLSSCSSPMQELLSFLLTSYYFSKLLVPKHLQAFDVFILTRLLYPFFTQTDASQISLSLG